MNRRELVKVAVGMSIVFAILLAGCATVTEDDPELNDVGIEKIVVDRTSISVVFFDYPASITVQKKGWYEDISVDTETVRFTPEGGVEGRYGMDVHERGGLVFQVNKSGLGYDFELVRVESSLETDDSR